MAVSEVRIQADASQAIAEVRSLRLEVEQLKEAATGVRSPRVQILHEPLTYEVRMVRAKGEPHGLRAIGNGEDRSYVQDFVLAESRGDEQAKARLRRHAQEMRTIGNARRKMFAPDVEFEFEQRAVNWAAGTGGYFAPPLWIIEQFATVPTPERVLSAEAPSFDLPVGAQSVSLPAWSAGADVGVQQVAGVAVSESTVDTAISSAVATIAGNYDVPMQMLEQSPQGAHLDWVTFTNMEARYGYRLEQQMINGKGALIPQGSGNNELLGLLNNTAVPSTNKLVYTDAPPTQAAMITTGSPANLAKIVAAIGNNRHVKPECWLMTTSRAAWLISGVVSFPLTLSNQTGPGAYDLLAYPVKQDDAIPTNLGDGGNEDRMICCRPSDWLVLESERRTSVMLDVISGALMARLQMRRYVAALLRYPSSVAWLTGTGMIVQAGF